VKRVIDGATLELDGGEKVRLLGVSIPEHFSKLAAEFARKKAEGQQVRLQYDQTRKDKDSRILAYVRVLGPHFMRRDGLSGRQNFILNEEIIYQGYGLVDTEYPFRELERYKKFEKEAKKAGRGLWPKVETGGGPEPIIDVVEEWEPTVYINKTEKKYHRDSCPVLKNSKTPILLKDAKKQGYTPCEKCNPPAGE
jgi:micrococcal nuclease